MPITRKEFVRGRLFWWRRLGLNRRKVAGMLSTICVAYVGIQLALDSEIALAAILLCSLLAYAEFLSIWDKA